MVGPVADERGRPIVLVVEDDPMIAQVLTVMFRDDFRPVVASTGREALALARAERPAVITLDLMLPDISGSKILDDLKADPRTANIPVIVVSAYTRNLPDFDRSRVSRVVAKPFSPLELLEAVRDAVAAGE